MSKAKPRVDISGGASFGSDPFASLSGLGLPAAPPPAEAKEAPASRAERRAATRSGPAPRLNLRRLKAGKGGKTVTEVSGFIGLGAPALNDLAKELKARCGVGGAVKGQAIEIQGDQRSVLQPLLEAKGYRVVLSGG